MSWVFGVEKSQLVMGRRYYRLAISLKQMLMMSGTLDYAEYKQP